MLIPIIAGLGCKQLLITGTWAAASMGALNWEKKRVKNLVINFDNSHHTTALGTTGTGKTYTISRSLLQSKKGVLFFNTVGAKSVPSKGFVKADKSSDSNLIKRLVMEGGKVNYIPSGYPEVRNQELQFLIREFLDGSDRDIIFAVDEVHMFKNDAKSGNKVKDELIRLATTGRNYGMKGVYLSQRPAAVDNTFLEMSTQWILFFTPMSSKWFNEYDLPGDEIKERLIKAPEHSFLIWNTRELKGIYKL